MGSDRYHSGEKLSPDVYISYAKSIGLAIERRVMDNPPRRPYDFWRMCQEEVNSARWRFRHVTGEIRKLGSGG